MALPAPVISVVVPTYNRRERLQIVLQALADQDIAEPYEVVVISDGSTDGTDDDLREGATPLPVVARFQENQGPAAARNTGIEAAGGEIVVFVDDDVVAGPALLRTHLAAQRRLGTHAVVIGPMLNAPDFDYLPWVAWEQEMLAKQYRALTNGDYDATHRQFYTGNASVRREHLTASGGFDTSLRRAEDVELAFRLEQLGLHFHYDADAIGYHHAERSYDAWLATAYAYGCNDVVFSRELDRAEYEWIIGSSYRRHHLALRGLVWVTLRSDMARSACLGLVRAVAQRPRTPAALVRYALSAAYAVEYHRGVADEAGSLDEFDRIVSTDTWTGDDTSSASTPD